MPKGTKNGGDTNNVTSCCICGESQFEKCFSALDFDDGEESFDLMRCVTCGLVRTEPILSEDQLKEYYTLPYYGGGKEKFKGLAEHLTYWRNSVQANSILTRLRSHQRMSGETDTKILDIGCGRGNLLKILKRQGCDCYGLERTEFPLNRHSDGIHFFKGKLQEISFKDHFFDAAVLWHVLEHLDNPIPIIQESARILKSGGILAIAVPNFGSFQAKLFRASWFHLDLPRHTYHFEPDTLLRCLTQSGFTVFYENTFSIEQNIFGFIQSFLNKTSPGFRPNHFYRLLKKSGGSTSLLSLLFWGGLASLIFPVALLEYLISGILGRGATLIVYAEKE
jgi:2-polyprenyl-3-methyl-5-hydroxy-6-metoxy-1,4-benzoquinol methylase